MIITMNSIIKKDLVLDEFYGESMSFDRINNISQEFHHLRKSWESESLDESYKIIYCDCQYQSLRRDDSYSKEAIHLIYGVDKNKGL